MGSLSVCSPAKGDRGVGAEVETVSGHDIKCGLFGLDPLVPELQKLLEVGDGALKLAFTHTDCEESV